MTLPVLQVEDLTVVYQTEEGPIEAVRGVSLQVDRGEILGLVGESGSGKSTVALAAIGYLPANGRIAGGRVRLEGHDIVGLSRGGLRKLWGSRVALVSQNPGTALNPALTVGRQLGEVAQLHLGMDRREAGRRSVEMLDRVKMPDAAAILDRYPHQLSGGMLQRCVIAMALMTDPALLLLDEPTTALDVTTQAVVLDLVSELEHEMDAAILYITHDLGVVARVCDRVAVLYGGELVEEGDVRRLFKAPRHPYTRRLLAAVPTFDLVTGAGPARRSQEGGAAEARGEAGKEVRLLEVRDLKEHYRLSRGLFGRGRRRGRPVKALDGVSLWVNQGRTLGVVGESGSGKTTLARIVAGLVAPTEGSVRFHGEPLGLTTAERTREQRRSIQMVFQNPDASLNPRHSVARTIGRPLVLLRRKRRAEVRRQVLELLEAVRLPAAYYHRHPTELSGGEKQRVAVARAFAAGPELVLCDEPLSALDVSVQAALMDLLLTLQRENGASYLFISHDLAAVQRLSDWIAVAYLGALMELGNAMQVLGPPYHPYTEALLSAIPVADPDVRSEQIRLPGGVPSPTDVPSGCRFHTRCPRFIGAICVEVEPPWREGEGEHWIYCHWPLEDLVAMQCEVLRPWERPDQDGHHAGEGEA